jgi:uncharacterized protein YbjT (DUF2867 family)
LTALGYEQVDHLGNRNVLREVERAAVSRFVYFSVLHGRQLRRSVALAAAKEQFVHDLMASPVPSTVVRPTGFFSDMADILTMTRKGAITLFGDGTKRRNPISGRDLGRKSVAVAISPVAHEYGPAQFLAAVLSQDMVAPQVGSDHLADDFISRAATEIFADPPGRSEPEVW